jgi:hypothetical protein
VRDEHAAWIPAAHILTAYEDSDIVTADLRTLKKWCSNRWLLRYMLTDDSAGEQNAIRKAFSGLIAGELEPSHLLCRVHCERTLGRKLAGVNCKASKNYLLATLKFRQTKPDCEESIELAIKAVPNEKVRNYIYNE